MVNDPGVPPLAAKRLVRPTSIAPQPIIDALALILSQSLAAICRYRLTYSVQTYHVLGSVDFCLELDYWYFGGDHRALIAFDDEECATVDALHLKPGKSDARSDLAEILTTTYTFKTTSTKLRD